MQHGEHDVAVLLDLRPLVAVARVLDREVVQAESCCIFVELFVGGIAQRDPDEAIRALEVVADVLDADVGELLAVLVGDAVDEHGTVAQVGTTVRTVAPWPPYRLCCRSTELPGEAVYNNHTHSFTSRSDHMSLISFIKEAGEKLFGKSEAKAAQRPAPAPKTSQS